MTTRVITRVEFITEFRYELLDRDNCMLVRMPVVSPGVTKEFLTLLTDIQDAYLPGNVHISPWLTWKSGSHLLAHIPFNGVWGLGIDHRCYVVYYEREPTFLRSYRPVGYWEFLSRLKLCYNDE